MKERSYKFISLSFILIAFILFLGSIGSNGMDISSSHTVTTDPILKVPLIPDSYDQTTDVNKDIDVVLEGVSFKGMMNGKVFPNTPTELIVETSGPRPAFIEVLLDSTDDSSWIRYQAGSGEVSISNVYAGIIDIDQNGTYLFLNETSKQWNLVVPIVFQWEYPKDIDLGIYCYVKDKYGAIDSMTFENMYQFEPDIHVTSEPRISVQDESHLTDDGYLRGGTNLKIDQVSIHFQGAPSVSPSPEDIEVGVSDSMGRFWPYMVDSREDLNSVVFSIPVPKYDDEVEFSLKVDDAPDTSKITGSADFILIVDSTSPGFGDFKYETQDDHISLDWAMVETGSGIDADEVYYRIKWISGSETDWIPITDPIIGDGRLSFDVLLDPAIRKNGDFDLSISAQDRVANTYSSDYNYHVRMDPTPDHDVAVDKEILIHPDPVIVNQLTHFRSTIYNKGTSDENDLLVEIMKDGQLISRQTIPYIPAGSSREIRWDWTAVEGISNFAIILDPYLSIEDSFPENNRAELSISSEYLDVFIKEDYVFFSDPDAQNMDLVEISLGVRSVGSIESGPIKILFEQDGHFMGTYQLDSIYQEGSRELKIDWKVDTSAEYLTLEIDPFNEILESNEENNIFTLPNPYYSVEDETEENQEKDPVVIIHTEDEEDDAIVEPIKEEGTIWSGPEIIHKDEGDNLPSDELQDLTPYPGPSPQGEPTEGIPPMLLPTMGAIIGTASIGLSIAAIRNEIMRFKLFGLLIPLYSKIKKDKVDKGVRHEILGYLKAKPGANYSELKRNLDLNDGSLVHHLRVLEREEKIYSKKMGKYKLFYVTAYRRESSIADYISPLQMRILDLINSNPGIVPKKLSKIMDRSQTDMSYHLSELSRNGLLSKKKKGRHIHYYLNDEFSEIFS